MNPIKLTVVINDISLRGDIPGEHGLCLHLCSGDKTMLFDAGKSDLVVANLEALQLADIPPAWIALSHGHYDHTTGVPALLKRYPEAQLHFHPKLLEQKWILDPGNQWRYGGLPEAFYKLDAHYLQPHRCFMELIPGVFASGSVAGDNSHNEVRGHFFRKLGEHYLPDAFPDEQILLVKTENGVSILSGCMHTGMEATLRKARELFPQDPFYALVGGLHLEGKTQEEFAMVLKTIQKAGIRKVMPLHCTGQGFVDYLAKYAQDVLVPGSLGTVMEL